ncbi:unnamed protein product [Tetraodon nigroviridis]|uniref:(spotted green pufferfish) hypothetical protein n=1 Tax=Tetraodon nigroviridis TaxID=99883 RepID=Q4SVM3_TETNG|nr:unnamed protein product [Tetraodon nigroviridis]
MIFQKEHSKKRKTKRGKQNQEERNETQMSQDNVAVITSPSTSFYASLAPRPKSIYDVLEHSATNKGPEQSQAKPRDKGPQNKVGQTVQTKQEDESVYENF